MSRDIDSLDHQVRHNREIADEQFKAVQTILLQLLDLLGYEIKKYGDNEVVRVKEDK